MASTSFKPNNIGIFLLISSFYQPHMYLTSTLRREADLRMVCLNAGSRSKTPGLPVGCRR